jgi:AcrR family transcriptional regulator
MPISPNTRSVLTLQRIIDATRSLLAQKDYTAISMREVAAQAGVSPGAIYKHFSSKQHLVDYVCHATLEEFDLHLTKTLAPFPLGSFDKITALGEAYIRLALEKPEHFKILFTPAKRGPIKLQDLPGEGGFRLLRQSIIESMEAGTIRQGDPDLASFFLWSRVHGIVTLLMACDFSEALPLPEEEITPLRLFELSRVFLWEGFKPEEVMVKRHGEDTQND